jgi:hypothetical protein
MNQRAAFDETVRLAQDSGMPLNPGNPLGLDHMFEMQARIMPGFSEAKLGRWLGWAQAALVGSGVGVTLDDVKQLNLRHAADDLSTALAEVSTTALHSIVDQQDTWIRAQAAAVGVTVEELAQDYEIKCDPVEMLEREDGIYRATQRMRLRRRESDGVG